MTNVLNQSSHAKGTKSILFHTHTNEVDLVPLHAWNEVDLVPLACEDVLNQATYNFFIQIGHKMSQLEIFVLIAHV